MVENSNQIFYFSNLTKTEKKDSLKYSQYISSQNILEMCSTIYRLVEQHMINKYKTAYQFEMFDKIVRVFY